jgi:prolipoprotein diacylglyceryl transferase
MVVASIPSPSTGVAHLGPLPLRGYAFMIILGVLAAVYVTGRRLRARGVDPKLAGDAAVPAVLLGIVGARIYHVVSSPDRYFGADGDLVEALKIWQGGLSIWGAVAGGALGVWIACRRAGVSFGLFADAAAPGLALAQAIGRWGNWFNQELYGRPTDLPWGVEINLAHRPADPAFRGESTFHPTFLYESLWNLGVAGVLLLVDRRRRLGRGKLFVLYVALYTAGRVWIEALRIDEAEKIFGLRVNLWVSTLLFVLATVALFVVRRPVDSTAERAEAAGGPEADGGEVEEKGAGSTGRAGVAKATEPMEGDGSEGGGGDAGAKNVGLTKNGSLVKDDGGAEAATDPSMTQRAEASAPSGGEQSASTGDKAAKAR